MTIELLTPEEVANRLKLNRRTIYRWLRQERLHGVKMGSMWRIPEDEIEALLKGGRNANVNG